MSTPTLELILMLILTCCAISTKSHLIAQRPNVKFITNLSSIREGEHFTLTCNHPRGSAKNLKILPGNEEIQYINDTAIQLNVFNTHQMYPYITYECMHNESVVKTLKINVYHKLEITKFDCSTLVNVEQNVTCEITLPFNQEKYVYYSLIREYPVPDANPLNCISNKRKVKCEFGHLHINDIDVTLRYDYNFTFQMRDDLGNTSKTVPIAKNQIGKLPAANIKINKILSNGICFNISGEIFSESFRHWPIRWNINVNETGKSVHFSNTNCTLPKKLWIKEKSVTCCLGELFPYREYNVSVNRRFKNSSIAHWSNETIYKIRTLCDKPSQPPFLKRNWFDYDADIKTLKIYWKQLPKDQQNGRTFHYNVRIIGNKRLEADLIDTNSATIIDWDADSNYTIYITSCNECGISANISIVNIPRLTDESLIKQLELKKDLDSNNLTWQFKKPDMDTRDLEGFTIFWCNPDLIRKKRCIDSKSIEYRDINATERSFNMSSLNITDYINIAVLPNFKTVGKNGGLNWILIGYGLENKVTHGSFVIYIIMPIVFTLLSYCTYVIIKKYKKMSKIKVKYPPNLLKQMSEEWVLENSEEKKPNPVMERQTLLENYLCRDNPVTDDDTKQELKELLSNEKIQTDQNNYVNPQKNKQNDVYTIMN